MALLVDMPSFIKHDYSGTIYPTLFDTFLPWHLFSSGLSECLACVCVFMQLYVIGFAYICACVCVCDEKDVE